MKKLICKIFGHRWKEFIRGDGTLQHYETRGKKCERCGKVIYYDQALRNLIIGKVIEVGNKV